MDNNNLNVFLMGKKIDSICGEDESINLKKKKGRINCVYSQMVFKTVNKK